MVVMSAVAMGNVISAASAARDERLEGWASNATTDAPHIAKHVAYFRGKCTELPRELQRFPQLAADQSYRALVLVFAAQEVVRPYKLDLESLSISGYTGPHPLLARSITFDLEPRSIDSLAHGGMRLGYGPDEPTVVSWVEPVHHV